MYANTQTPLMTLLGYVRVVLEISAAQFDISLPRFHSIKMAHVFLFRLINIIIIYNRQIYTLH